ncbi:Rtr1/RPAP2 family-domain-containing protein [Xylaria palmicola]|nr:Rtr1/RPAP2 family-domain-containing protein [Xylaria palmicola]
MSAQTNKPKSILKNKGSSTPAPTQQQQQQQQQQQKQPDPREVAIKHARIIHSRREVEDRIADSLIELSRFPATRHPARGAAHPAPADAESFKDRVRLYQPGDYDDLIEERNANGLCGYALCPNPRSRVSSGGAFKLLNYGHKDFNIVPSRELEKWCSQKCAKRAMYVKVQLSETAAWERAGIASIQIELFEEEQASSADDATTQLAKDVENMKIEAEKKTAQNARDLALERGDTTENGKSAKRSIKLTIREKPVKAPEAPSLDLAGQGHLVTEGYKTTFDPQTETVSREQNSTSGKETASNQSSVEGS